MADAIWQRCLGQLQDELPAQQFNTWIRPLQLEHDGVAQSIRLVAPNRFVMGWVEDKFLGRINELFTQFDSQAGTVRVATRAAVAPTGAFQVRPVDCPGVDEFRGVDKLNGASASESGGGFGGKVLEHKLDAVAVVSAAGATRQGALASPQRRIVEVPVKHGVVAATDRGLSRVSPEIHDHNLNEVFTFDNFVEGKSNQLARAAAQQVAENPGGSYNPLFIYGGVGLGKTHLMHAVGNALRARSPGAKIVYLHSERFVADMVKALQLNAINEFKRFYRSVDALLIDDIQFFARKDRSQEEFFHTFNALLEGGQQMILTCDRYPKEIQGVEERLKSRFAWGLTVAVEPPELETRVAILIKKAQQAKVELPYESAFFIAQRISSNVRELEGALKRVIAGAHFMRRRIDIDLIRESLKDLLALQDKLVTIDNIQRIVAEYYKIKMSDMLSKRRSRSVARPRQVAMALAKEMTNHSLPEIGEAFGGRDHTTVLHACRKVKELQGTNGEIREDLKLLTRSLKT